MANSFTEFFRGLAAEPIAYGTPMSQRDREIETLGGVAGYSIKDLVGEVVKAPQAALELLREVGEETLKIPERVQNLWESRGETRSLLTKALQGGASDEEIERLQGRIAEGTALTAEATMIGPAPESAVAAIGKPLAKKRIAFMANQGQLTRKAAREISEAVDLVPQYMLDAVDDIISISGEEIGAAGAMATYTSPGLPTTRKIMLAEEISKEVPGAPARIFAHEATHAIIGKVKETGTPKLKQWLEGMVKPKRAVQAAYREVMEKEGSAGLRRAKQLHGSIPEEQTAHTIASAIIRGEEVPAKKVFETLRGFEKRKAQRQASRHKLRFDGIQEGFGSVPDTAQYTAYAGPYKGRTFNVPKESTMDEVVMKLEAMPRNKLPGEKAEINALRDYYKQGLITKDELDILSKGKNSF